MTNKRPPGHRGALNVAPVFLILSATLIVALLTVALGAQPSDYVIGPRDVLAITNFDQAELSGEYTVVMDGTIGFPLIGRIMATGFTVPQFEAELKRRLLAGKLFRDPQLTVAVAEYRSQQVFVVGEVRAPGSYPLTGSLTLLEALAVAGGSTGAGMDPSLDVIVVRARNGTRRDGPTLPGKDPSTEVIRVNLADLQGGQLSEDIQLQNGDTVVLPRAELVYVAGEVKSPGAYPIQRNTTVLQAVSLAGGVTEYGSTNRVKIVRLLEGQEEESRVEPSDLVRSGDTIIVLQRIF